MSVPVWATSPLPYAIIVVVALAASWGHLPRRVRVAGVAVEVLLVVLMMPLGANALMGWLRSRVPSPSACAAPLPDTIVVLGGGASRPPQTPDDYTALHLVSLQRLLAGVALWRKLPDARLVLSGGSHGHRIPEAVLLANLAGQLGVPDRAIELESRSQNTWENARNVAMLAPPVPRRIWLVSSPEHLPRALGAFRAWGFEPCAWPASPVKGASGLEPSFLVPSGTSVRAAAVALHELFGGVEYAWLEWRHAREATRGRAPGDRHRTPRPQTP